MDALGNPVRLILTAGQASEYGQANALIEGFSANYVLADKGYDSDAFILAISSGGLNLLSLQEKAGYSQDHMIVNCTRSATLSG